MYATLADVEAEKKSAVAVADRPYILRQLREVTARIARLAGGYGYDFEPRYAAVRITPHPANVNSRTKTLDIGKDLLEIIAITADGTPLTEGTTVYAEPLGEYPIRVLRIDPDIDTAWWPSGSACDPYNSIVITGFWGYRRYYDQEGFLATDTIQDAAGITANANTVTVDDSNGADYYGLPPRFSPGMLIRMDNELAEVTAVDDTTSTLTILRGQRGTTAAAHATGVAIHVWNIEPEIRRITARQVALQYARKGAFQQAEISDLGIVTYPGDLASEVRGVLQGFMYR